MLNTYKFKNAAVWDSEGPYEDIPFAQIKPKELWEVKNHKCLVFKLPLTVLDVLNLGTCKHWKTWRMSSPNLYEGGNRRRCSKQPQNWKGKKLWEAHLVSLSTWLQWWDNTVRAIICSLVQNTRCLQGKAQARTTDWILKQKHLKWERIHWLFNRGSH